MGIIVLLISISIVIALLFLGIFIWNLRTGQFDDTTTPGMRMIFDDHKRSRNQHDLPSGGTQASVNRGPDKNQGLP